MGKILVVYESQSNTTKAMAEAVAEGIGSEAMLLPAGQATREDLLAASGLVLGSPCYYGSMSASLKRTLEQLSPEDLGKLEGKPGGAFAASLFVGGGNELTILSMVHFLLAHGMVVQGVPASDHFGPVCVGKPTQEVLDKCRAYGARIAKLAARLGT